MTPQEIFWAWFHDNENAIFDYESAQEEIFDSIGEQLRRIDKDLTFEIGAKHEESREFVISAGGIKRAFPSVTTLAAAAPYLNRWKITAFRPRREVIGIVNFHGKRVHPEDVEVELVDNGKQAGIYLFIPNYKDGDPDFRQIGYLLLDDALGEFDVETKVALIKMFPPEAEPKGFRFPLSELPQRFHDLLRNLGERTIN